MIPFSKPELEECLAAAFHVLHLHITGETVDDLRHVEQGAVQSGAAIR